MEHEHMIARILAKVDDVIKHLHDLHDLNRKANHMLKELSDLTAQVAANNALIQQVIDAGGAGTNVDPAALAALTSSLLTTDTALANMLNSSSGGPGIPNLVSISVSPTSPSLTVGATQQMGATGTLNDGSSSDITSSVIWTSDNESIATVSKAGLITGVSPGDASVKATSGTVGGKTSVNVSASLRSARR
jgi:uncharacterized protein YjdB